MSIDGVRSGGLSVVTPQADLEGSVLDTLNSVGEVAASLGGDTNAQVAAMLLKHAHQRKSEMRQMRSHEEEHLQECGERRVAAMRKQAELEYHAAVKQALGGIAAGVGNVVGGSMVMRGSDPAEAGVPSGSGDVTKGALDLWAAGDRERADQKQADAAEYESRAGASERRLEDLRNEESDASELIRTALDFVKNASESTANANRNALFQRV